MDWLKLDLNKLRSPQYLGSEPEARATWLNLTAYCVEHENGGRIEGCAHWKDRMWQQIAGVTYAEVRLSTDLYTWDGEDLIVWGYPSAQQKKCQEMRERGRKGGQSTTLKDAQAYASPDAQPDASTEQSRAEQSRVDKRRAEQRAEEPRDACGGSALDLQTACAWIDSQNGRIPDKPRAKSLARELIEEMTRKSWKDKDGARILNPMGLLVDRLKKDRALLAQVSQNQEPTPQPEEKLGALATPEEVSRALRSIA